VQLKGIKREELKRSAQYLNYYLRGEQMPNDAQEFLNEIREVRYEIASIRLHKEDARMALMPSAVRYDKDKVQTTPDDPMLKFAVRMGELDDQERYCLDKLHSELLKAEQMIEAMKTPKYRQILRLRYLNGGQRPMSWEDIAKETGFSETHLRGYMHGNALAEFRKIYEKAKRAYNKAKREAK
jgi:transcriptional regulator with XRE-family HTH domain